jgi:flagellar basal body-associated protein FliL
MRMTVMTAAILSSLAGGSVAAGEGNAAVSETPAFVSVTDIAAPIFSTGRLEGAVNVSLMIEARNAEAVAELEARMPELRASLLDNTLEFSRLYASGFTPVDAERLSKDLTASLKKTHPGVRRVLILKLSASPA